MLEIFCRENNSETKLFEFQIPAGEAEDETYPVSYYARFPVKQFTDKTLILRGDLRKAFFDGIRNEDVPETEEKSLRATQGEAFRRPSIHFTPQTGWMNDPNGLVYAEGVYHLYFQHNPFDVQWENMSWGHAVSRDLLHWEQKDDVLFPDETGTMFSGSGIVNDRKMLGLPEDALVFSIRQPEIIINGAQGNSLPSALHTARMEGRHSIKLTKVCFRRFVKKTVIRRCSGMKKAVPIS